MVVVAAAFVGFIDDGGGVATGNDVIVGSVSVGGDIGDADADADGDVVIAVVVVVFVVVVVVVVGNTPGVENAASVTP